METGAALHHLHLYSPDPQKMADFYCRTYGMLPHRDGDRWVCVTPGRLLVVSQGEANRLAYATYAFADAAHWADFRARLPAAVVVDTPALPMASRDAVAVRDPDGNTIVFVLDPAVVQPQPGAVASSATPPVPGTQPFAHLQHFALRTTQPEPMLAFYRDALGFILSDRVEDEQGDLRACFLRTGNLHHALAIFMAPVACFDHQSFETDSWADMRMWGDYMAGIREPIVWGIGRHGPGNDVFFMVRDPDGNLAEISAEIEVCAADRPAGVWVHEERTLNLWGKAIMRG